MVENDQHRSDETQGSKWRDLCRHDIPFAEGAEIQLRKWQAVMKMALIALALWTGSAGVGRAQPPADLDIFLLMGQSNMSGRASLAGAPAFAHASSLWMFRNEAFIPAREPVSDDPDAAFGPSLAFADSLFERTHRAIGLINCARGGTKIAQWTPSADPASLYRRCLDQLARAADFGRVRGVIFYQGEYDSWDMGDATAWAGLATHMLESLRKELGAPSLPIIVTQIGPEPPATPRESAARVLIAAQGAMSLAGLAVVSAQDLPFQDDHLHLTQEGELLLGASYADAMWRLMQRGD